MLCLLPVAARHLAARTAEAQKIRSRPLICSADPHIHPTRATAEDNAAWSLHGRRQHLHDLLIVELRQPQLPDRVADEARMLLGT